MFYGLNMFSKQVNFKTTPYPRPDIEVVKPKKGDFHIADPFGFVCFHDDASLIAKTGSPHRPPNINIIPYRISACPSAFYPIFISFSYGTSHLAKSATQSYHKDTKKE